MDAENALANHKCQSTNPHSIRKKVLTQFYLLYFFIGTNRSRSIDIDARKNGEARFALAVLSAIILLLAEVFECIITKSNCIHTFHSFTIIHIRQEIKIANNIASVNQA